MSFGYALQKFGEARRALMLPLWEGRTEAIVMAGHSCRAGLDALSTESVDEDMTRQIQLIEEHLTKDDVRDPRLIAADMTDDEVCALASAINELADYAHREFWYNQGQCDCLRK